MLVKLIFDDRELREQIERLTPLALERLHGIIKNSEGDFLDIFLSDYIAATRAGAPNEIFMGVRLLRETENAICAPA
jgi:hypothetical protein